MGLDDARRLIEAWRVEYNTERPHSALGGLAPVEYAMAELPTAAARPPTSCEGPFSVGGGYG